VSHKSGFVNIIGSPNVGKSTLMNALVGERLSIITSKAQTTRHRIFGIVNGIDYQIVYSDTPGLVNAAYKLHEHMMSYVHTALKDADILLFITDGKEKVTNHAETLATIQKMDHLPILLLINKIDLMNQEQVMKKIEYWKAQVPQAEVIPVSALHKFNMESVYERILELLPEGPAYFDKDQLTDRPMRFFMAEMIREKIFLNYEKEIPYSTEVVIESYTEEGNLLRIRALIMVERESQKNIVIGKGGSMLKIVGTAARKDMEQFSEKKVFLEMFVKVDPAWRSKENRLKFYGYSE
jgi:GTPase